MYQVGGENPAAAEGAEPAPAPVRGFVIAVAEEESAEPAPAEAADAPAESEATEPAAATEAAEAPAEPAAAEAPADDAFAALYAAADPAKGEKAFKKCKACHSLEQGVNGTGPSLYGVVGRPIGTAEGFKYSADIAGNGGTWTPEELNIWLENPKAYAGSSKMNTKTKKAEDRANLIAYLATIGG
ncbi:MAG: cytochrome c family protein [Rhodobacterales bacterium]|nr:MAG: cytochrome c family protein [Rhodobacterales bacterium]